MCRLFALCPVTAGESGRCPYVGDSWLGQAQVKKITYLSVGKPLAFLSPMVYEMLRVRMQLIRF